MSFDPFSVALPVTEVIPSVRQHLNTHHTLLLSAPPGAGKSTLLPLALLNEPWLNGKKIVMLEPRRLAASTVAQRMASLLREPVGRSIGYRIRFENRTSAQTRIEVVTEGILTRMLQQDNALEDTGLIIFDEFHERSIHTDVALALCRESQLVLRPDLRLMVMSATMDMDRLALLLDAPVVESKGKQYPVGLMYTGEPEDMRLPESCARVIMRAIREQDGDVLAFLPGEAEIRRCEEILGKDNLGVAVYPLYGQLGNKEQQEALQPGGSGNRKVVLATAIAETSLTIEGVSVVVDSGFGRFPVFDPASGLSRLQTRRISLDSADQRTGRAGRLGPGYCYRMWTQATQARLAPYRTPEILEADLSPLLLDMLQWGVADAGQLTWLTQPPPGAMARAADILQQLNAMKDNKITPAGRQMQSFPCHPRLAHMLLMAASTGRDQLATDVAALLEERDPLPKDVGVDMNLRLEALRRHRHEQRKDRRMDNVEKIAASYRRLLKVTGSDKIFDPFDVGLLLAQAYPERVAQALPGQSAQFRLANGKKAQVSANDSLAHESWLAIAQMDARDGLGKIFIAAPLNPLDLQAMVTETDMISWDTRKGELQATRVARIGSIVLHSRPLANPDPAMLQEAIVKAIKNEGTNLLNFPETVTQWQNRVLSLRAWRPQDNWPDMTTSTLINGVDEWLSPFLQGVKTADDLKGIDVLHALQGCMEYGQLQELDKLAPASLEVPSGSMIKLVYRPEGEAPVLAVRLQEVFGMLDTPRVNNGRTPVVLHLLSPGFKPVQVTTDLRSFWQHTYFEVRKELKRRYPKHAWPEDPLLAEAVRGVKKR